MNKTTTFSVSEKMMQPLSPLFRLQDTLNRRTFLTRTAAGIGSAALASLLGESTGAAVPSGSAFASGKSSVLSGLTNFPAKAKRVIFLFQAGGPSQMDLLDYKPVLE